MKTSSKLLFSSLFLIAAFSGCNKEEVKPECGFKPVPTQQTIITACSTSGGGTINACANLTDSTLYAAASSGLIGTCGLSTLDRNESCSSSYLAKVRFSSNGEKLFDLQQQYSQSDADETIEALQIRIGQNIKLQVVAGKCGLPN